MRPVRAGKKRHRITIQTVAETRDATGGVIEAWSTYLTAWSSVEPLYGREYFESAERQSEVTHRFCIRYRSGVTAKMRISWDSRIFDIQVVRNIDEMDREIEILAREQLG